MIKGNDEEMERDCQYFVQKTNADRIRAMSDEELAIFLAEVENRRSAAGGGAVWQGLTNTFLWLKQPAEEENGTND